MLKKQKNLLLYVIEFICSLFLNLSLIKMINMVDRSGTNFFGWLFFFNSNFYIIIFIIYKIIKETKGKLQDIFLSLIIPIGLLYLFLMIPGQVPDENTHYYRIYEISRGKLGANVDERNIPESFVPEELKELVQIDNYDDFFSRTNNKTNYKKLVKTESLAQTYFSILYILPSIAFFIGRILNLNIIYLMYLGRIANFIFFLICGYYSIKRIPFGKVLLTTYLFVPMVIHQAASVSPDSVVNSIAIFFICFIMDIYFREKEITKTEKIIFYMICCFMAFAKTIYVPLLFVSFILFFKKEDKNQNNSIIKKLFCKEKRFIWYGLVICFLLSVSWLLIVNNFKADVENFEEQKTGISILLEKFQEPGKFVKLYFNTIKVNGAFYLKTFIGSQLGWLNIKVNEVVIWFYSIILMFSPYLEKNKFNFNKKHGILFMGIFLIILFMLLSIMYVHDDIVKDAINGIQGRYFTPILILLLLCMCKKGQHLELKRFNLLYPLFLCCTNLIVISTIIKFFS